jgi:acyl-coenzyme A thioesterase PaaI-like protein
MDAEASPATVRPATAPSLGAGSLEEASTFVRAAGLVLGEITADRVTGHLTAGPVSVVAVALNQGRTQQLWQVNLTDEAGRLIAHGEVRLQNVSGQ